MKTRKVHILGLGDDIISMSTDYIKILEAFKELVKSNPRAWMQTIYQ